MLNELTWHKALKLIRAANPRAEKGFLKRYGPVLDLLDSRKTGVPGVGFLRVLAVWDLASMSFVAAAAAVCREASKPALDGLCRALGSAFDASLDIAAEMEGLPLPVAQFLSRRGVEIAAGTPLTQGESPLGDDHIRAPRMAQQEGDQRTVKLELSLIALEMQRVSWKYLPIQDALISLVALGDVAPKTKLSEVRDRLITLEQQMSELMEAFDAVGSRLAAVAKTIP